MKQETQLSDIPLTGILGEATHSGTTIKETTGKCSCLQTSKGRNLVICVDGTANQLSVKNTNIVELYSRLVKNTDQLTYYDSGIGTYVKPSLTSLSYWFQLVNHSIDMAIAWNFKKIVLSAYQWLSENYEEGDRIFLFGFSRGAYQVRVIAGMIERVGLLHKGNNNQIPFAYELYIATTAREGRDTTQLKDKKQANGVADLEDSGGLDPKQNKGTTHDPKNLCKIFKKTLSRQDVRVHFVGAWDTVSSIGITRGPSLPETTTGMKHVCVFRHALALDERRVKFLPEYVNGGMGPKSGEGDVKEVWFAGAHSDIGGGNKNNLELNQFGPSLRWMTYEAIRYGLKMTPYEGQWSAIKLEESLSGIWKILEYLPLCRLSYKDAESTTRRLHLGRPRKVMPGQKIHKSVFNDPSNYKPQARIQDKGMTWEDVKSSAKMTEQDPFTDASVILSDMRERNPSEFSNENLNVLISLAQTTDIGLRSITEFPGAAGILIAALEAALEAEQGKPQPERQWKVLRALIKMLAAFPSLPIEFISKYRVQKLQELANTAQTDKESRRAMYGFVKLFDHEQIMKGHDNSILSVAFSLDGQRIVSGSYDRTIHIWDVGTRKMAGEPLEGHDGAVRSVAFSPDGKRIVSCSDDCTIRIWDVETRKMVGGPLEGHNGAVRSVAFSPDGKRIVSGSDDCTIRIWDVETRKMVGKPLEGHSRWVQSVAFSPDGKHIVSGSDDCTIRIWDVETRKMVGEPLEGHSSLIWSVAFSPDGMRIVSGSFDRRIRIWDVETRRMVGEPLEGHSDLVLSVAFSPDGKRITSGSNDRTIRIWDVETRKTVGGPVEGHNGAVRSVAFSPDGKHIVSGSSDCTIRIWDMEVKEMLAELNECQSTRRE